MPEKRALSPGGSPPAQGSCCCSPTPTASHRRNGCALPPRCSPTGRPCSRVCQAVQDEVDSAPAAGSGQPRGERFGGRQHRQRRRAVLHGQESRLPAVRYDEVGGYGSIGHLIAGDDVYFARLVAEATDWRIVYCRDPEAVVACDPGPESWSGLMHQKLRHASKAGHYRGAAKLLGAARLPLSHHAAVGGGAEPSCSKRSGRIPSGLGSSLAG